MLSPGVQANCEIIGTKMLSFIAWKSKPSKMAMATVSAISAD
jgi:hypothetical protein